MLTTARGRKSASGLSLWSVTAITSLGIVALSCTKNLSQPATFPTPPAPDDLRFFPYVIQQEDFICAEKTDFEIFMAEYERFKAQCGVK